MTQPQPNRQGPNVGYSVSKQKYFTVLMMKKKLLKRFLANRSETLGSDGKDSHKNI